MNYNDIHIGAVFSFERKILEEDVRKFAELSGDFNPLHVDEAFGRRSSFGQNIAHGMLCGSLFSQLVGMHCPGENCLYLTQSLNFKSPVFYNDNVTVRGTVLEKNDSVRIVTLKTELLKGAKVVIDGEAKLKVME